MSKNKKIVLSALLLAILVILSRFLSVRTPIVKISFGFIPTMLCAIWLGPKYTILINILGDLIGALLFPTGPYFYGYTISTAISGLIYGLLLYVKDYNNFNQKKFVFKVILSCLLVMIIVNIGLNTLWTSITTASAFKLISSARIIKELIMFPIKVILILFIEKALRKPFNKYIRNEDDLDD